VAETTAPASLRLMLHGKTDNPANPDHHTRIWLNNQLLLEDSNWDGQTEHQVFADNISQFFLKNGENYLSIECPGDTVAEEVDQILLNWLEVDYWHTFTSASDLLEFSMPAPQASSKEGGGFRAELKNFSAPNIEIYATSGTQHVGFKVIEDPEAQGTFKAFFLSQTKTKKTFLALLPGLRRRPKSIELRPSIGFVRGATNLVSDSSKFSSVQPPNLRDTTLGAEYLVITDSSLRVGLSDLVKWREAQGLTVKVVEVEDIYDQFNFGISNSYAIRDFLRYAYHQWVVRPKYVLIVGDTNSGKIRPLTGSTGGSREKQSGLVPTIMVQTPKYGATASDNQFVLLADDDHLPDVAIGRLPVSNLTDLQVVINKILSYESLPSQAEEKFWRQRILVWAGNGHAFVEQSEALIKLAPAFQPQRIYANDPDLPVYGAAREVISAFDQGASLVNFLGHGGGSIWSDNRMMGLGDVALLNNRDRLPFVISMTCFTGYFDNPHSNCLGEEMLLAANGGAIAFLGDTGFGWILGDYYFNRELFKVIFEEGKRTLGEIILTAKRRFLRQHPGYIDIIEMYTLLGDPALRLNLPPPTIQIQPTDISVATPSQLLITSDFSGQAEVVFFDQNGNDLSRSRINLRPTAQLQVSNRAVSGVRVHAWNQQQDAVGYYQFQSATTHLAAKLPDLVISRLDLIEHQSQIMLSVEVQNLGQAGASQILVKVSSILDRKEPSTEQASEQRIEKIGIDEKKQIMIPWQPQKGITEIQATVELTDGQREENSTNNRLKQTFVGEYYPLPVGEHLIRTINGLILLVQAESPALLIARSADEIELANQPDLQYQHDPVEFQILSTRPDQPNFKATFSPFGSEREPVADQIHLYQLEASRDQWVRRTNRIVDLPGTYAFIKHTDIVPPELNLTLNHQSFIAGDYASDTPVISARISDRNGVRLDTIALRQNNLILTQQAYSVALSPENPNLVYVSYQPHLSVGRYHLLLSAEDSNGNRNQTEIQFRVAGKMAVEKVANYPNPFSPGHKSGQGTYFAYLLTDMADQVTLKIYTLTGRLVSQFDILDGFAGYNEFYWDGLDDDGDPLANGAYLYKLVVTQEQQQVEKIGKIAVANTDIRSGSWRR